MHAFIKSRKWSVYPFTGKNSKRYSHWCPSIEPITWTYTWPKSTSWLASWKVFTNNCMKDWLHVAETTEGTSMVSEYPLLPRDVVYALGNVFWVGDVGYFFSVTHPPQLWRSAYCWDSPVIGFLYLFPSGMLLMDAESWQSRHDLFRAVRPLLGAPHLSQWAVQPASHEEVPWNPEGPNQVAPSAAVV